MFDAFDWLSKGKFKDNPYQTEEGINYYRKNNKSEPYVEIVFENNDTIIKNPGVTPSLINLAKKFIGRSSIRVIPRITNNANPANVSSDLDSPETYIENDTRFINDVFLFIQQIVNALSEPVFSGKQADTLKIFRDFIEPLNNSLLNIFGGDDTTTIQIAEFQNATPNTTAKLIFKKGESKINYDLLSHGEKQVIILLINFIVRQEYYKNSIIFIDEMDCHLNTSLQSNLLHEIVSRWIPDSAQLWTASHALGFIDYARNSDIASTIDFNLLNFDTAKELIPLSKDKLDVYEIAIPKSTMTSILKGYKLVVVENKDGKYYNNALGTEGYLFLPANDSREVFQTLAGDKDKLGLRDRDYLRADEIEKINAQMPKLKILLLSTFENYIYHPDNIAELKREGFNKEEYITKITDQKNENHTDIIAEIGTSRAHYIELKNCISNDKIVKPITDALSSDKFEDFYPYFNMKKHFNKTFLSQFNLSREDLSKTDWFKKEILKILNS